MAYVRYPPAEPPTKTGWDAWAADYATLGADSVYALAKEQLHAIVDAIRPRPGRVLDFNCGAGDDLARFQARGWSAVGCDGSIGMLRAAAARCPGVELWHGRAEELTADAFGGQRFDLIFSTTGGFAYLDDDAFVRAYRALVAALAPGGRMVTAHLGPFAAAESIYHLLHLRPRRAAARWRGTVPIEIRGERMLMRLRSARRLRRLVHPARIAPLLLFTPPFQSGFRGGPRLLALFRALERRAPEALATFADQIVCIE